MGVSICPGERVLTRIGATSNAWPRASASMAAEAAASTAVPCAFGSRQIDVHWRRGRRLSTSSRPLPLRAEPAGMLKVTAPLPVGIHILAPALPRFRKRYPKLAVDLRLADRQTDLIAEGIDVALRVGNLADSRLLSRRLAPHRLCAFASPGYLERMGIPQSIEELSGHECVNFRYQSSGQSLCWPFQVAERMMEFTPNAGIVVDASDGVPAVLAAGGGIGISPTYAAACHVRRGELVPVLP